MGGEFFGPLIIQMGIAAWVVTAIVMFCNFVRYSDLRPAWVRYLVCSVAAGFGAVLPIIGFCFLYVTLPWVAVLSLPLLLLGAITAIWRTVTPPRP